MLTVKEIENKQFTSVGLGRGYAQSEVDDFLDQVGQDYATALNRSTEPVTQQLPPVPAQPPSVSSPKVDGPSVESIALLLQTAQRTHVEIVEQAKREAAGIVANAHIDAQKITAEATARAQAEVLSLDATRDGLVKQVNDLNAVRAAVTGKLEGALATLATQESE